MFQETYVHEIAADSGPLQVTESLRSCIFSCDQEPRHTKPRPFVYAAKAHPELVGPDATELVVTYAKNSFEFAYLLTKLGERFLCWPRFVVVRARK